MLCTTAEARTKYCLQNPRDIILCSGPRCMGWRWSFHRCETTGEQKGYCGVAGPAANTDTYFPSKKEPSND